MLKRSDSGPRMLDRRGEGLTYPPSELPGVSGEFEYGDERGEFGSDAIACSPVAAGEEGVDRGGLPFRLFGRGGGCRPPTATVLLRDAEGRTGTADRAAQATVKLASMRARECRR